MRLVFVHGFIVWSPRNTVTPCSPRSVFEPQVDARAVRRQPFLVGEETDVGGKGSQTVAGQRDHARPLEEVVGGEPRGPSGGPAGGQHVRRARRIITGRHWREMAQEDRAGVGQARQKPLRLGRRDVQVLGRDLIGDRDRLVLVTNQHQSPEPLQAVAGQTAPAEPAQLVVEGLRHLVDQARLPCQAGCWRPANARPG